MVCKTDRCCKLQHGLLDLVLQAAALRWAAAQVEAGKLARCLNAAARAAAAGVLDKALDVREAGTALMLALLQACIPPRRAQPHCGSCMASCYPCAGFVVPV